MARSPAKKRTPSKASKEKEKEKRQKRESGVPGGGQGRRDEVGPTGVYPASAPEGADDEARVRGQMGWGQGERGAEGYYESGTSELPTAEDEPQPTPEPVTPGPGRQEAHRPPEGKKRKGK